MFCFGRGVLCLAWGGVVIPARVGGVDGATCKIKDCESSYFERPRFKEHMHIEKHENTHDL